MIVRRSTNLSQRKADVRTLVFCLSLAIAFGGDYTMAQEPITVLDFGPPEGGNRWRIVNDGVMGGLSRSRMDVTPEKTGVFQGTVSLENNGGFASVRTKPAEFGLSDYKGLVVRVKGDGKRYQLRLRTDQRFDGIAYKSTFDTVDGEWITVKVNFEDFSPTFRGRPVPQAPPLEPSRLSQIGFLIADKVVMFRSTGFH